LEEASKVLTEEDRRIFARAQLRAAIEERSPLALRPAIAECKNAGVEPSLVEDAMQTLAAEERKAHALEKLEHAVHLRDIKALQLALTEGRSAGVLETVLEDASKVLAAEEWKITATADLRAAMNGKDLDRLRAAVTEAYEAEVDAATVNHAWYQLCTMDLEEAVKSKNLEELRTAIAAGVEAGLEAGSLEEAMRILKAEERKESAMQQINQAMGDGWTTWLDVEALQVALEEAKAAGVAKQLITWASDCLAAEQTKVAIAWIEEAQAGDSPDELKEAIRHGSKHGVGMTTINRASRTLARLERQATLRKSVVAGS